MKKSPPSNTDDRTPNESPSSSVSRRSIGSDKSSKVEKYYDHKDNLDSTTTNDYDSPEKERKSRAVVAGLEYARAATTEEIPSAPSADRKSSAIIAADHSNSHTMMNEKEQYRLEHAPVIHSVEGANPEKQQYKLEYASITHPTEGAVPEEKQEVKLEYASVVETEGERGREGGERGERGGMPTPMNKSILISEIPALTSSISLQIPRSRNPPQDQQQPKRTISTPMVGAVSMRNGIGLHLRKGQISYASSRERLDHEQLDEEELDEGSPPERQFIEPNNPIQPNQLMIAPCHPPEDTPAEDKTSDSLCNKWFIGIVVTVLIITGIGVAVPLGLRTSQNNSIFTSPTMSHSLSLPSIEPTQTPTTQPTNLSSSSPNMIISFFRDISLNPAAFNDWTSPEYRAATWMANHPDFIFERLSQNRRLVRYALATLYYSTGGENWTKQKNWLNYTANECDWEQDMVHNRCQGPYNTLWLLTLEDYGLNGTLPADIGLLTDIEWLELPSNQIHGTIPSELGLVSKMQVLSFGNNSLTGTIPNEFGNFASCLVLDLPNNLMEGSLPSSLEKLKLMTHFHLHNNGFSWNLPTQFGRFTDLKSLLVEDSGLEGTLMTEIGKLVALEKLQVSNNPKFGGTFATELGKLQKLSRLDVSNCGFDGSLPTEIGSMTSMEELFLKDAKISGELPTEMGLLTHLNILHLEENILLSGTIPTEFGQLTAMEELDMAGCNFGSTLPSEIGRMTRLTSLRLNNNSLSGTIPREILLLANTTLHTFEYYGNDFLSR